MKDLRNKCCIINYSTKGFIGQTNDWFTNHGFCNQECFNDFLLKTIDKLGK